MVLDWKKRPLPDSLEHACTVQHVDIVEYIYMDRPASVRMATSGVESVWDHLNDVPGWLWHAELRAFVCCDYSASATALDLVGVGILGIRVVGSGCTLCDGFLSIKHVFFNDILCRSATCVAGRWCIDGNSEPYKRAHRAILGVVNERLLHVREETQRREKRLWKREEARAKELVVKAMEEEEEDARWEAAIASSELRAEQFLNHIHSKRYDTRAHITHAWELKRIASIMHGKPLMFEEWTPPMFRECDRAGVVLAMSRVGAERFVNAVYPNPPPL